MEMKKNSVTRRNGMRKAVLAILVFVMVLGPVWAQGNREQQSEKSIHVVYIPITSGIPYFDPIIEGMKNSVEKNGGQFSMIAPNEVSPTSQIPLIRTQIQRRVDVICISPNSVDALNATLDEAKKAGIIILTVNDDILGSEQYRDGSILSADYNRLAEDSFKAFAEKMNHSGSFVVLSSTTDAPFQNNQIAIYRRIMESNSKYADMKMLEVLYGNDEPLKSLTESEAALQKYPNLDGIMSPTTVGVIAAAQAVENANRQDRVVVYGLGTPNQTRNYIKSGVLSGAMLWDTYRTGYVAGEIAYKLATDAVTLEPGKKVEVSTYDAVEVLENNVMYAGPPLDLDTGNIDDHDF
jgi:rhamnose transport system substrate-binding protein